MKENKNVQGLRLVTLVPADATEEEIHSPEGYEVGN